MRKNYLDEAGPGGEVIIINHTSIISEDKKVTACQIARIMTGRRFE
jgi:hypothetical protein